MSGWSSFLDGGVCFLVLHPGWSNSCSYEWFCCCVLFYFDWKALLLQLILVSLSRLVFWHTIWFLHFHSVCWLLLLPFLVRYALHVQSSLLFFVILVLLFMPFERSLQLQTRTWGRTGCPGWRLQSSFHPLQRRRFDCYWLPILNQREGIQGQAYRVEGRQSRLRNPRLLQPHRLQWIPVLLKRGKKGIMWVIGIERSANQNK